MISAIASYLRLLTRQRDRNPSQIRFIADMPIATIPIRTRQLTAVSAHSHENRLRQIEGRFPRGYRLSSLMAQ